ncbi:SubName: Full=Uncharacterized protein {ECO:0000313/EMBL:CCA74095.1} [Serendipita indica DSM 11827]|nr:SubName: Full=Uncharacterized protein {ECO:0000313/EMBL:CCA74095.1} [Serendipita indica DSM 11827]
MSSHKSTRLQRTTQQIPLSPPIVINAKNLEIIHHQPQPPVVPVRPSSMTRLRKRANSMGATSASHSVPYPAYLARQPRDHNAHGGGRGSPTPYSTPSKKTKILFYDKDKPFYGFTNFSPHSVVFEGRTYPTSEHVFQAYKFIVHRPGLAEHIRTFSKNPRDAFNEARRFQPEVREDWAKVKIDLMYNILKAKFSQHSSLKRELMNTGDAELIEDSPVDAFWGCGANGKGENQLGKTLMRLRDFFRSKKGLQF